MRVLHVVEAFGGGVFEVVKTLAQGLDDRGDEVAIAYGRRPETPSSVRESIAPEVELFALPWRRHSPVSHLRAARSLRSLIRRWRPDVVHLHSSFAGLIGALTLPSGVASIYTPHGYSFTMLDQGRAKRAAYRALERLTAKRVTAIGAVSEAEAAAAREIDAASSLIVVRNGIPELDQPDTHPPEQFVGNRPSLITLGRITAQHLPAETARILAAVSDLAEVAWVGGGGRGDVPASVVIDQGVPVTGWLDRQDAQRRLSAATACLHWTAWDGQPLSVMEAMANDVIVIAHDIPATREMLGPAQVCAGEEEAIRLLRRLLSDDSQRERMLASQRERRRLYSADRMVTEWRSAYERIARRSSGHEPASTEPQVNLPNRPERAAVGRPSHP